MARAIGFERGMGIGGWLTNYKRFAVLPMEKRFIITIGDREHFDTYITEEDVIRIASLGMDHARVGFDQVVLEPNPYEYDEHIFDLLDTFAGWCEKHGLNAVFNLHKCLGNYCGEVDELSIFDSEEYMDRFVALWIAIEKRFANRDFIAFEPLNEIKEARTDRWNKLARRTIKAIRDLNPDRKILIGGGNHNSYTTLKDIDIEENPNNIFVFHFYTPHEFTHQRGVLQPLWIFYNRNMEYPAPVKKYVEYEQCLGFETSNYDGFEMVDINYLRHRMQPVFDFAREHPDAMLYCSEFGVIRHCKLEYKENWMRDVMRLFKEHNISYCAWNYLSTPNDGNKFSLMDDDTREILSPELARIIRGDV